MAPWRLSSSSGLTGLSGSACALALILAACGSDKSEESSTGGSPATGGQTGSGGRSVTGGQSTTGGVMATGGQGTNGGKAASGGQNASGGLPATGGQNAEGGRGGSLGPTGGTSSAGVAGGGAPSGGAQNGGGGAGGSSSGGVGGGAPSGECTRALLDGLLDGYFKALAAGDPSTLPLSADVKVTENAKATAVGKTDLWMKAAETKHSQRSLDTGSGSAADH